MQKTDTKWILSSRSLEVVVPVVGLVYSALVLIYETIRFSLTPSGLPPFIVIFIPFVVAFIGAAVGVWRRFQAGYIAAVIISGFFLVLIGNPAVEAFTTPAVVGRFVIVMTVIPTLAITLAYSALGLRTVRRKSNSPPQARTIPRNSAIALVALGFIAGGLMMGLIAGVTQLRLLSSAGGPADIVIAIGAVDPSNSEFYVPATFSAEVGQSVTWANRDPAAHTVTSTRGSFDSGNMDSGATYQFTFTQSGTYEYICTYHPWMKGSVTVTSG